MSYANVWGWHKLSLQVFVYEGEGAKSAAGLELQQIIVLLWENGSLIRMEADIKSSPSSLSKDWINKYFDLERTHTCTDTQCPAREDVKCGIQGFSFWVACSCSAQ